MSVATMSVATMRIAALQLDTRWEDRVANYNRVRSYARQAHEQGADLFVLPDMFATGFSLNTAFTAEPEGGPTAAFLRELAQENRFSVLGGFVLQTEGGRGHNVARMVDPDGRIVSTYAKTHLFTYTGEHQHHAPGDGPVTFPLAGGRASAMICYDLRFPEIFRRVVSECWLMMVIAAWPTARQRPWDILLPARAVENQSFFLGLNQVGRDGNGNTYTGGSALYDPLGVCVAHAGAAEKLMVADLQPARVAEVRTHLPFLQDRRL